MSSPNTVVQGNIPDQTKATILIVDDQEPHRKLLSILLKPHYHVQSAATGAEALAAAGREPCPDLILLDVMMPDMDGFSVLRQLRQEKKTSDIPVIFVTALPDEEKEMAGLAAGAADFVHKPIKGAIVLSRIRVQLEARAARELLRKTNAQMAHKVVEGAHALEEAQKQLLQSEKLAAMGQLAAGVAHEINNPIGFVGSNLSTLENYLASIFRILAAHEQAEASLPDQAAFAAVRQLRSDLGFDAIREDISMLVAESKDGIQRVRQIAADLKDFSRADNAEWVFSDLHHGLDSTLNIVWNELKYHCTVTKRYGDLPSVRCLPGQINQVFMNLLVNAAQAIEGKGDITITTECLGQDQVRISISDSGKGIAAADMPHIFEPFFTTKPVGKGTGLGLSLSQGIIERHQGKLEVSSEVGKGTTFSITLPVATSAGP